MSNTPRTDEFLAKNGAAGNQSKYAKFTRELELENQRLRDALKAAGGDAQHMLLPTWPDTECRCFFGMGGRCVHCDPRLAETA